MRFLFTRRWLQYIGLAVIAAIACGLLANWQNERRESRDAEIDRIEAHYSADPVPLESVVPTPQTELDEDEEWTRVSTSGVYRTGEAVLARNRPKEGRAGYWVLVPFDTADGATVLVARGWIAGSGADATTADLPAPPAGEVDLTAWLRPAQTGTAAENTPATAYAPGSVLAIDPDLIVGDDAYQGVYAYLEAEEPAPAEAPDPLPAPDTDPGSHLSYTMQWIAFGIMILVGVAYAAKRERDAVRRGDRAAPSSEPQEYVVVDKAALAAGGRVSRTQRYVNRPSQRGRSDQPDRPGRPRRSPGRSTAQERRARSAADEDAALEQQLR